MFTVWFVATWCIRGSLWGKISPPRMYAHWWYQVICMASGATVMVCIGFMSPTLPAPSCSLLPAYGGHGLMHASAYAVALACGVYAMVQLWAAHRLLAACSSEFGFMMVNAGIIISLLPLSLSMCC